MDPCVTWGHALLPGARAAKTKPTSAALTADAPSRLRSGRPSPTGRGREADLAAFEPEIDVRVVTRGSSGGEMLPVTSGLEPSRWDKNPESAQASPSAAVSLVSRLVGREADPAKSRERVPVSILAECRLRAGGVGDLGALLRDLADPPRTTACLFAPRLVRLSRSVAVR